MSKASGRFCATDVELEAIGTYPQSVLTMVQREGRVVPSRGRPLGSGKGATSTSTPKSQNIASTSTSNNTSPKPVTRRSKNPFLYSLFALSSIYMIANISYFLFKAIGINNFWWAKHKSANGHSSKDNKIPFKKGYKEDHSKERQKSE
uniref:Uncharacterized protein n=1 Tax=Arundo donax TaxID=35708 RepID=A0A0A8XRB0_ARUDO